jgi:tryptophan halogenase
MEPISRPFDMPESAGSGDRRIRRIVIVGGGTAGWVAASMLARALPGGACTITLVESPDVPIVGVGEATIPPFVDLLNFLSIDQADFIRHTQASYKLGIRFDDWLCPGTSYWHPFGTFGQGINRRPFLHAWHRARHEGTDMRIGDYSACAQLGEAGRFLGGAAGERAGVKHALHFDAARVAGYLRSYATTIGVRRLERTVLGASLRPNGFIEALQLDGDEMLHGDLFIDCSGFRAVLAEQVLHSGWLDWSDLLPCDTAIAAPTTAVLPRQPFTRATARAAGWRWRIPLQHRTGNGYVYCSGGTSKADAEADFLAGIDGKPIAEPRLLRFQAGRRRAFWTRNCIAVGLASGFLEPLESTSIHLAISAVYALLEHFPDRDFDAHNIAAYNSGLVEEIERARDFIFLHYHLSARDDSDFWRQMRATPMPDTLRERVEIYRATGRIRPRAGELFTDLSWFYVLDGMGVRPSAYDPLIDIVPPDHFASMLAQMARQTEEACRTAPSHDLALSRLITVPTA